MINVSELKGYAELLASIGVNKSTKKGELKVLCPNCVEIKTAIVAGSAVKCQACGLKVTHVDEVECRP